MKTSSLLDTASELGEENHVPAPHLYLHQAFEEWADRTPNKTAIIAIEGERSFAELDRRANCLAHALLRLGHKVGEPVGVLVDRSADLPLAFLGILKAGGVYVPMLADLPARRLANMAGQAKMRRIIALDGIDPPLDLLKALSDNDVGGSANLLRPAEILAHGVLADNLRPNVPIPSGALAAILFTSGSTGLPKGVQIRHEACLDLAAGHAIAQGVTETDRLLLSSSPGFILGFRELFLPLALGCAWVPCNRYLLESPEDLVASMEQRGVTVACFTPSYLRLLDRTVPAGLRMILTAGERPNTEDGRHYARYLEYWNLHGATEVCGTFCMHRVQPEGEDGLPSGRPFPNTKILLLDHMGEQVGEGEEGEIFVISPRLSPGYLGQDAASAESFVQTPFGRAFRTRDLGRWTAQGELLTLGRSGDTIKISGQAVALGEIEHALLGHGDVQAAAILQHRDRLIAFVEAKAGHELSRVDWSAFVAETLPAFMVPARTLEVAKMPVSSAGKVDRMALLAIAENDWQELRGSGGPPCNGAESTIAAVWAQVLSLDAATIGREDNFFRIGGSSLLAIRASQKLQAAGLPANVRDILGSLSIAALAENLSTRAQQSDDEDEAGDVSATEGQADFWVAANFGLPSAASHVARALRLLGMHRSHEEWRQAWSSLVRHHPALRTGLKVSEEGAVLLHTIAEDDSSFDVHFEPIIVRNKEEAGTILRGLTAQPFNLANPPLARAGLFEIGDSAETLFWFVLHHAIADGMSATQIQNDLLTILTGKPLASAIDALRQASRAERVHLASPAADRDQTYWLDQLGRLAKDGGAEAFEPLPFNRPSESAHALAQTVHTRTIDAGSALRLTALANRHGAGMHALLTALLAAETGRRTGRAHVLIGSGITTRPAGTEEQVGHFVNLLPLPLPAAWGLSLAECLDHAQAALTGAILHGLYPARRIAQDIARAYPDVQAVGQLGLTEIAMTANPQRTARDADTGFSLAHVDLPGHGTVPAAGLNLSFSHELDDDGAIQLSLVHNAEVVSGAEAEDWLDSIAAWATWLAEDPTRFNSGLPQLLPSEISWLTRVEHGPIRERPAQPAHHLFEHFADKTPYALAVVTHSESVTYEELNRRANRIAHALISDGLHPGQPAAVMAENGPWLPAAILGIWKAGGIYVPLTGEMPVDRAATILNETGAKHLILLPDIGLPLALAKERAVIRPETLAGDPPRPDIAVDANATAYIIFTSGTTGTPKGTLVRHDGMINAILSTLEAAGCDQNDRVAVMATPSFDASLWEIGMALLHGLPMVPITRDEREDPWAMKDQFRDLGVTLAFQAPSYLRVSKEKPFAPSMRMLLVGGEAPSHDDVACYPNIAFWNPYGPTETSIIVSLGHIPFDYPQDRMLHVGGPIPNAVISIRREDGSRVPPGCSGEVWLGGVGVGGGYLNNPDLTARMFVDTPEGRMYRSGDLGRWSRDGKLELAGRIDQQIKLHGQRIEPAEIEQHLQTHPDVRQASVIVGPGAAGTKVLRGFIHLNDGAVSRSSAVWREFLAERLPAHMVPATITAVQSIPYTANGKLDHKKLLAHAQAEGAEDAVQRTAPHEGLEAHIATLWAELLGADLARDVPIAREDNFFALGGDSLRAISMAQKLSGLLGTPVSARELFAAPILAAFARRVAASTPATQPVADSSVDPLLATEGEREFWTAQEAGLDTSGHIVLSVRQIDGAMPDRTTWNDAWQALVARQPALRTTFAKRKDGQIIRQAHTASDSQGLEWLRAADGDAALRLIRERQLAPFDMARAPLWRAGLVQQDDNGTWLFWIALHHAIGDGRSLGILLSELAKLLEGTKLPELAASPERIALQEQAYFGGPERLQDEAWWSTKIASTHDHAFNPLTLDFQRPIDACVATHRLRIALDEPLSHDFRATARAHSMSLYAMLISVLAIEAYQREGRDWLVVGTAVSTMEDTDQAALIGYGVNMLPLFLHIDASANVGQLMAECQNVLSGALQHARYPFARIYTEAFRQRSGLRDPMRFPLFDIAVTENPPPVSDHTATRFVRLPTDEFAYELTESGHGQDLVLIHESLADGCIALELHANARLFSRETATSWMEGLTRWAGLLARHDDLANLPLPAASGGTAIIEQRVTMQKEAPHPGLEQQIAELWTEVLGVCPVSRGDNFFALGGNSLLAITMVHKLSALLGRQVAARNLFAAPVLAIFAERLAEPTGGVLATAGLDGRKATEGEREFWTALKAGLDTSGHIMPLVRRIRGATPEIADWQKAWRHLIARHSGLRCQFREDEAGVLWRDVLDLAVIEQELDFAEASTTAEALSFIHAQQRIPFDLACGPLWRAGIVAVEQDGSWLFWLAQHHATGDGRSFGVLCSEFLALLSGEILPALRATPETISAREQAYIESDASDDAQWWAENLASLPTSTFDDWATDWPRTIRSEGTHHFATSLNRAQTDALLALASSQAASLHGLLLALLAHVVHRRTGRGDFLIGTTASIPESAEEGAVIHYGVNMLPLCFTHVGDLNFRELLALTRKELIGALAHSRYPFSRIYQEFRATRVGTSQIGRYPLFDIAITENPVSARPDMPIGFDQTSPFAGTAGREESLHYERMPNPPGQDMVLTYQRLDDGGLLLDWQMNAALYHRDIAQFWLEGLADAARWLATHPTRDEIPTIVTAQASQLTSWGDGGEIQRPSGTFVDLFESIVDTPGQAERPALLTADTDISYGDLDQQANALSHRLIATGVEPGDVVAVLTDRSVRLSVAVLAIWKAGATFLPLAANLPDERLSYIVRDAGATALLVLDGHELPPQIELPLVIDVAASDACHHRPAIYGSGTDCAYILYTSGSTGLPKGVPVTHDGYLNVVMGCVEAFLLTPNDRCLGFAAPSFDVSLSDIGIPLAAGAAFCPLTSETIAQPAKVAEIIIGKRLTLADLPPSYLRLLDTETLSGLRILVTGGDAPLPADVARLADRIQYFNAYGATEASITSTMGRLVANQVDGLDCGRPLPNVKIEIRDPETRGLVPPGAAGEIWLGGMGLATTYLNRPEQSERAFLATDNGRRYCTGDFGRWRSGGRLELLGRIDQQVKLNGIRIEPGEIEAAIATHPAVLQAVAIVAGKADERQSLWAFAVRQADGPTWPQQADWKAWLGKTLPAYMIPAGIHLIDSIPMTPAGKIDRDALLSRVDGVRLGEDSHGTPPLPGLETEIAQLWAHYLGCGAVTRADNFFSLGGHSLLAIALCHSLEQRLGCAIPAHWLFGEPVLCDFAARVAALQAESCVTPPIEFLDPSFYSQATDGEREFWVAQQAGMDTSAFTMTLTVAVDGAAPDNAIWQHAWSRLVKQHDALRTHFAADDDLMTVQRLVDDAGTATFEFDTEINREAALKLIAARQSCPFDMEQPPLWRAGLVRVENDVPVFWLAMHHSISDGVSLGVLMRDLSVLLAGDSLPAAAATHAEGAREHHVYLASSASVIDGQWWREELGRIVSISDDALAEWPSDNLRPAPGASAARSAPSGDGRPKPQGGSHVLRYRLAPQQAQALRQIARDHACSMHTLMLTMLGLEVKRRTGRDHFLLGTAASTRTSAAQADVVGYYVNQLPIPFHLGGAQTPANALKQTNSMLAQVIAHSRYPHARIVSDFRKDYPEAAYAARHGLFNLAVTENPALSESSGNGGALRFVPLGGAERPSAGSLTYTASASQPLQEMLLIHETLADGGHMLSWMVNAELHNRHSAEAWMSGIVGNLLGLLDRGADTLLPSLLPAEIAQLEEWEQGEAVQLPGGTIAEVFSRHVANKPDQPAIITDTDEHSYAETDRAANAIAARLYQLGVRPGNTVGVYTERSAILPIIVLAIWKTGGCYLPLTQGLPDERLAFMADDAAISVLVVSEGLIPPDTLLVDGRPILKVDDDISATTAVGLSFAMHAPPQQTPAVILYTSGSTGTPKGVVISHTGLVNLGLGVAHRSAVVTGDRLLSVTSPSFDLWMSDLVMIWCQGGSFVPATREEIEDLNHMQAKIRRLGVTMTTMTPSYLRMFDQAEFPSLRWLMTVGEAPILSDVRFYAERLEYFNGYGPTENTAAVSVGVINPNEDVVPAGRPLPNVLVMILDAEGRRLPPGAVGEAWIGGASLAIGYSNRPDLTEQVFIQTSFGRMYRTGDMARWRHDGQLIVLGRIDGQVKLRGQRVELGEIEQALICHPLVAQAAAVVAKARDGAQALHAFVVPTDADADWPSLPEWKAFLATTLPGYMIPTGLHCVDAIVMTPSGKIDRKQLERRLSEMPGEGMAAAGRMAPVGRIETAVAEVWASILDCPAPSREDHFFKLGGDSLRAIAVISRLRQKFDLQINDLYEHPVLEDFALRCKPRSNHLRSTIQAAKTHWLGYHSAIREYEAERSALLDPALIEYDARNSAFAMADLGPRADYRHPLLTGATGYVGAYLLRQLLAAPREQLTTLVRASEDAQARLRLLETCTYYFGPQEAERLCNDERLTVLAGDLRRPDLGLERGGFDRLSERVDAVIHSAANVRHFGHYRDFKADNVDATSHLIELARLHARRNSGKTADMHMVSTMSVFGSPPEDGFRLYSEYDPAPDVPDQNYYIRSKQDAERLVSQSRDQIANACIHRVGNIVYAADGGPLQRNIKENAFFRLIGALTRLGLVPDDSHVWLCHVDVVAAAVVALAETPALANFTHHVEHDRRDMLSDFITGGIVTAGKVREASFDRFLEQLAIAVDQPEMETAVADILESFGLLRGISPQARGRRMEVRSDRTQQFLCQLGIEWPEMLSAGQVKMIGAALETDL